VILVRQFTEAEDVAGFHAARGVLTSEGGKASHAALVARGMGVPAVTGASDVEIDARAGEVRVDGQVLHAGDRLAIDGTTGTITTDDVPLVEPEMGEHFETVLRWADELRTLGVRANADTPADAAKARQLGAEGIGLCRTEHMFFGEDRQEKMVAVILADDLGERRRRLGDLLELQQGDFEGLFDAMRGLPVTIRLLDPPLHEFLPHPDDLPEGPQRDRARSLQEVNPMLGTRGCRLGVLYPEIYEMQVEAILRAIDAVRGRTGERPHAEIMIPLVDYERELEVMEALVARVAEPSGLERGQDFSVGTMIELPRACFLADHIARHADFFSFGTNDLTQTGLGFSRDDIEGRILGRYIEMKIFDRSPFETIDAPGVGQMLRMGAWLGRKTRGDLTLGVCGEHGGDPDSIDFFHHSGIDYVSCSPFRVPVARVAAAQAAVRAR
jgi:pyruvate, orthophosphate dikinase